MAGAEEKGWEGGRRGHTSYLLFLGDLKCIFAASGRRHTILPLLHGVEELRGKGKEIRCLLERDAEKETFYSRGDGGCQAFWQPRREGIEREWRKRRVFDSGI